MDTKGPIMVATALGLVAAAAFFNQSGSGESTAELVASDATPAACNTGACGGSDAAAPSWQRRSTTGGAVFISPGGN